MQTAECWFAPELVVLRMTGRSFAEWLEPSPLPFIRSVRKRFHGGVSTVQGTVISSFIMSTPD